MLYRCCLRTVSIFIHKHTRALHGTFVVVAIGGGVLLFFFVDFLCSADFSRVDGFINALLTVFSTNRALHVNSTKL